MKRFVRKFGTFLRRTLARATRALTGVSTELTPEQKVKFEELQKEREASLHQRFGDAPASSKRIP